MYFNRKTTLLSSIRRQLAILLALFARKLLLRLGRNATSFPGQVALKIYPDFLKDLCQDRSVLVITGTNGKTSTTSMIYDILKASGALVVSNRSGANMPDGIISSALEQGSVFAEGNPSLVLEVDEAWFAKISHELQPQYLLVTNLFNDQLDRYGDVYATRQLIIKGMVDSPDLICFLCADDPFVASLSQEVPGIKKAYYYGMNFSAIPNDGVGDLKIACPLCLNPLEYTTMVYAQIGSYHCSACALASPQTQVSFSPIEGGAMMTYGDGDCSRHDVVPVILANDAIYHQYNSAGAFLVGMSLGVDVDIIRSTLEQYKAVEGRNDLIILSSGQKVCTILMKNAVGFTVSLRHIFSEGDADHLLIIVHNNESDGRDTSWLKQVDYSPLLMMQSTLSSLIVSGQCADLLAEILVGVGIELEKITVIEDLASAWSEQISRSSSEECIYVLPNYTAMLEFRNINIE